MARLSRLGKINSINDLQMLIILKKFKILRLTLPLPGAEAGQPPAVPGGEEEGPGHPPQEQTQLPRLPLPKEEERR